MVNVRKPFFVLFQAGRLPDVDHSRPDPGGGRPGERAGYTSMAVAVKLSLVWSTPRRSGQDFPLYARSINVVFLLRDIKVAISSEYARGSCPYQVTYRHEFEQHVKPSIRLFYSHRDRLVDELNRLSVPTEDSPRRVGVTEAGRIQSGIESDVASLVRRARSRMKHELDAHQRAVDRPERYRALWAQCPAGDW